MTTSEGSRAEKTPFRLDTLVRARVERACQSPFYSQFREETTRQACTVYEAKLKSSPSFSSSSNGASMIEDSVSGATFFPFNNDRSGAESRTVASRVPECVTLIGGTGFFGRFVAEQYLNRGISVTVLARDVEKAKSIFVPIASGEREVQTRASKGYVSLPARETRELSGEGAYIEGSERRKVLWYRYDSAVSVTAAKNQTVTPPTPRSVTLEIVEGDLNASEDVEFAVRRASVVYYLVPAREETPKKEGIPEKKKWYKIQTYFPTYGASRASATSAPSPAPSAVVPPSGTNSAGFLRAFDACRRVDAHFVSLTPLWVHGSRLSPVYWYRRLVTHPWGYVKAVSYQEHNLLETQGTPSPRCYFGTESDADDLQGPPVWWYWWSILRSTKLPADAANTPRSPVRFSLFRLSDIVYPAFNTRMIAVKNNRVDSALHVHNIDVGDLDARLLANVLAKTLAMCTSVVESRIDVGGRLRGDVDMRDAASVLGMFSRFRNEE